MAAQCQASSGCQAEEQPREQAWNAVQTGWIRPYAAYSAGIVKDCQLGRQRCDI